MSTLNNALPMLAIVPPVHDIYIVKADSRATPTILCILLPGGACTAHKPKSHRKGVTVIYKRSLWTSGLKSHHHEAAFAPSAPCVAKGKART